MDVERPRRTLCLIAQAPLHGRPLKRRFVSRSPGSHARPDAQRKNGNPHPPSAPPSGRPLTPPATPAQALTSRSHIRTLPRALKTLTRNSQDSDTFCARPCGQGLFQRPQPPAEVSVSRGQRTTPATRFRRGRPGPECSHRQNPSSASTPEMRCSGRARRERGTPVRTGRPAARSTPATRRRQRAS